MKFMLILAVLITPISVTAQIDHPSFPDDAVHLKCQHLRMEQMVPEFLTFVPSKSEFWAWGTSGSWGGPLTFKSSLREYSIRVNDGLRYTVNRSSLRMNLFFDGVQHGYQCRISSLAAIDDYAALHIPKPRI